MAEAIDIDLLDDLQAYWRENRGPLRSQLVLPLFAPGVPGSFNGIFDLETDVRDELVLTQVLIGDIVKPYNKTFSGTSGAEQWVPRTLKVRAWKAELEREIKKYQRAYINYVNTQKTLNPGNPVQTIEQFITTAIIEAANAQLRRGLINGTYDDTGTDPEDIMDGLSTLVAAEITGGNITNVSVSGTVLEKTQTLWDSLGNAYKNIDSVILAGPTPGNKILRYNQAAAATTNKLVDGSNMIINTRAKLIIIPEMSGNRCICTTPNNIVVGVNSLSDSQAIRAINAEWTTKFMLDGDLGIQLREARTSNRPIAVADIS